MALIQPFGGNRYTTSPGNLDVSTRIAPPYDVLDQAEKDAFLARDARNFVAIDLPHMPPKTAGPWPVYEAAAKRMNDWLGDRTLTRDATPAIYPYYQKFTNGGVEFLRKKFFARLRLEEFGKGQVFPHEQTFGGPKEDRLSLTKATAANLSPIFGLYEDAGNVIAGAINAALPAEPIAVGTLDGVESRMWSISDTGVIGDITRRMADKAVYIADGHHRYGTSLLYREWLTQQRGPLPDQHPANFVLCVFCAMEDAGLLILPTHRVLPGKAVPTAALQADASLEVTPLSATSPDEAVKLLATKGPQAIALFNAAERSYVSVRPRDAQILRELEPGHSPAWRGLGLSFLHAYVLERVVTPRLLGGTAPEIHYVKSAGAAVDEARETNGSVFLLQATTMTEMRDVCKAGDLMPQKSTYFFPKLASGMVIHPLS